jgi:hypothetical protein
MIFDKVNQTFKDLEAGTSNLVSVEKPEAEEEETAEYMETPAGAISENDLESQLK